MEKTCKHNAGVRAARAATRALAATALLLGSAATAGAVEYKVQGEWLFGFGGVQSSFVQNARGKDTFDARQRIRLQLEAAVSESLSGTIRLELGDQKWGLAEEGAALGADGNNVIGLKDAYLDWAMPGSALKLRMGIQTIVLPNAAGGSSVMDEDVAGITAAYQFNENVGLTAFWMRPFNDNFAGYAANNAVRQAGFLDNSDYFGLSLPVTFNGVSLSPWVMLGFVGRNGIIDERNANGYGYEGSLMPASYVSGIDPRDLGRSRAYATQFYAGLPVTITALDPWNFELDLNYGWSEGFGNYTVDSADGLARRASSQRQGFLVKALAEYKFDWAVPGIFAWYASGDDGDLKNGSERMPAVKPSANFTSFMQDGVNGWSVDGGYDLLLNYAGTWGIGLQLRDISFVENLSHVLRVAYWGGTNSPSTMKYLGQTPSNGSPSAGNAYGWNGGGEDSGLYLTTADHLIEFNLDTTWKVYENLEAVVELGYILNGIDNNEWRKKGGARDHAYNYSKADAWKAALIMKYSF